METELIDGMKYNEIERPYSGENYTIGESAGLYRESWETGDNTNMLQMVESLDADLYMFALNEQTYELDLIGGSANEGVGIYEYFNCVMEAGTYFFAVGGYEGTGNFAFAYYQSTSDVSY